MRKSFAMLGAGLIAGLAFLAAGDDGLAATTNTTVTITIASPMKITVVPVAPNIACETPAGTAIAALSLAGGTGSPVAYSVSGSADFAVSGSNLVVGSNGIASADCGKNVNATITATQ
jgi:hypothetical protein